MDVSPAVWGATLAGILAVIAIDLVAVSRRPHRPTMRESTAWVFFYIALALAFGAVVAVAFGSRYAGEFYAGWLTEYSLSVDNLFVFVIIMSRFRVPATAQQTVLIIGVILALVFRGIFIALGAAAIARFSWVFYLFGAFLLYTAYKLFSHDEDEEDEFKGNALLRLVRRVVPTAPDYDGIRLRTTVAGRRLFTPMLVVMVAIGTTDVLFALDSIPAIYGLTSEPYLVLTANIFALMGLRQLYFLLGNLLKKLVYLSLGLSVILAFIGVKLVLHAMHEYDLDTRLGFDGEISLGVSLWVIVGTLAATTIASIIASRRSPSQD